MSFVLENKLTFHWSKKYLVLLTVGPNNFGNKVPTTYTVKFVQDLNFMGYMNPKFQFDSLIYVVAKVYL